MSQRFMVVVILALVGCAFTVPAGAQDWSGSGRVTGTVKSTDGSPIKGAMVYYRMLSDLEAGPPPFTTNKKGRFSFLGIKGGRWVVRVEADGYHSWETPLPVDVYSSGVSESVNAVLEPIPQQELTELARYRANQHLEQGDELARGGDLAGARGEYEKAMVELETPDHPVALAAIAATHVNEGNLEEAKAALEKALTIDDSHVDSLKAMCAILAAEGRVDEAETMLARIPDDLAVHPTTLINVGMAHYNRGEADAAKPFLDRAILHFPETAIAYYFRGLVALSLGTVEDAKTDFEKYLELAPEHANAAEAREYLSYLTGASEDQ
jgi:tetratricopeptide (TPR) repeat protein